MSTSEGQVFDLGYLNYAGLREGRARARKALFVNGIRTCFGLGRGAMAKALPIVFFLSVMAPAAVFAVMSGLFGEMLVELVDLPGHEDYYQIVSVILFLFAAIIAPRAAMHRPPQRGYQPLPRAASDLERLCAWAMVSLLPREPRLHLLGATPPAARSDARRVGAVGVPARELAGHSQVPGGRPRDRGYHHDHSARRGHR